MKTKITISEKLTNSLISSDPKVSIIILQYNNSRDTLRCLESVKEQDYPNFDVIMVDNASATEHVNSIRLFIENQESINYPSSTTHYSLLATHSNIGYSGGNNMGIKHALERGAQYVLILNPDVVLEKDTLSKLVAAAESDHKIGILGPAVNESRSKQDHTASPHGFKRDKGNQVICCGKIKWYRPELQHVQCSDVFDFNSRFYFLDSGFYLVGACILISKSVLQLVGMFDERYFLYFEDADLCLRARKAGWKLAVVQEATAHHRPSSSTKTLGSPLLFRYHYRNAHLFVLKNERCLCKYILLPLWSGWIVAKQLVKLVISREPEISRAILAGVRDFYKRKFGKISNSRSRKVQLF